jgi:uncharacterized sulfatase
MPRAKANGYDYGIHVPLAIRWGKRSTQRVIIDEPVGFVDLSATVAEVAGLEIPDQFVGESLLGLLSGDVARLDHDRAVFSGRERHSSSRYQNLSYPQRMMRRGDFLIIWSARADLDPAGAPRNIVDGELSPPHSAYFDIDDSMIKRELLARRDDFYIGPFFHLAVDKRPEWQFYNVSDDPDCLIDLAEDPEHARIPTRTRSYEVLSEAEPGRIVSVRCRAGRLPGDELRGDHRLEVARRIRPFIDQGQKFLRSES